MQKWEYKVKEINYIYDSEIFLNNAGNDGWELVGIYRDKIDGYTYTYAVFKRPM